MPVLSTNPQRGEELRERRRRLKISQQKLAAVADCSLASVRLFEGGYDPLRSPTLERIEQALDELEADAASGA